MRIGSGIAAAVTITLIAAAGVGLGDNSAGALADRSGRPAQPRALAQAAEPSAPAEQPGQQPSSAAPAAPAPAPPAGAALPNPASGTPAVVLDDQDVSSILGKSVRSSAGEDMGRIVDVLVGQDGQIRAAVIDFGGFLGIGTRKMAVDWRALKFAPGGKPSAITLELARESGESGAGIQAR